MTISRSPRARKTSGSGDCNKSWAKPKRICGQRSRNSERPSALEARSWELGAQSWKKSKRLKRVGLEARRWELGDRSSNIGEFGNRHFRGRRHWQRFGDGLKRGVEPFEIDRFREETDRAGFVGAIQWRPGGDEDDARGRIFSDDVAA